MDLLALISQNFLSPPVLFFMLGALVGWAKSPLKIPDAFSKAIVYFLMISIGLQGGLKISMVTLDASILKGFLAVVGFSFFSPFILKWVLDKTSKISHEQSSVISMYYGSISIVTFVAGMNFLIQSGIPFEGHLIAMAALMEIPAILSGFIILSRQHKKDPLDWNLITKEVLLNPSVVLLLGSFVVGAVANAGGKMALQQFFVVPFQGIMCLFLLEMGLMVARNFVGFRKIGGALILFSMLVPLLSAVAGVLIGNIIGLSMGGTVLFGVLCASASYVAVPAVVRATFPDIDQSTPLSLSMGLTFPFNVIFCIPFTYHLSSYFYK